MVYQGPSRACARCKQRHIKCDESRPSCRNCIKRQLECPGYAPEPGIRFQDETSSTINQAKQREQRRPPKRSATKDNPAASSCATPSTESIESAAIAFFFDNYATLGRGSQSSQGLFELIVPIFRSAAPSSAMSAATSAVALTLTSEWHGRNSDAPLARRRLGKALSLLRSSLNDPVLSLTDDTMMAVLLLKFHDMLVACKNLKEVPEDHVNGAIALVKHRGLATFKSPTSKRLLQYIRHTAVACAIQRRTPIDKDSEVWADPEGMLNTPCTDLDWIGVDIANLRASAEASRVLLLQPKTTALDENQIRDLRYVRDKAANMEIRLSTWADKLSGRWRPISVPDLRAIDPSIRTTGLYGRICHVYHSPQIAEVWNLYREYCLLVLELLLRCEALLEPDSERRPSLSYTALFQNIVDDLCASVPFLLGNRTEPSLIEDFDLNTGIKFLKHPDNETENVDNLEMDMFMDEEQRSKSLLAQGAWALQDHLSTVIRFVTSEAGEQLAPLLRPDQVAWMQRQVQRILTIQRIDGKGKGPELRSKRSTASIGSNVGSIKGKGKRKQEAEEDEAEDEGV